MANLSNIAKDLLNLINSITTAVEIYQNPEDNTRSIYLSENAKTNILNFLVDFFKQTQGYDFLVNELANYITKYLPYIEHTCKGLLLGYLQTMISCSLKPIINEQMILDGVYFDLQEIDLCNLLKTQPVINTGYQNDSPSYLHSNTLNDPGRYLYFGCDEIQSIQDLDKCRDFNAFLWYVKNTPGVRITWVGEDAWENGVYVKEEPIIKERGTNITIHKVEQMVEYPKGSGVTFPVTYLCTKKTYQDENGITKEDYYTLTNKLVTPNENGFGDVTSQEIKSYVKQAKKNGIITLEYNAKASGLTDAEHNAMNIVEPIQNNLHIFMGCCTEILPEKERINEKLQELNQYIIDINNFKNDIINLQSTLVEYIKELEDDKNYIDIDVIKICKEDKSKLTQLYNDIGVNTELTTITDITRKYFPNLSNYTIRLDELNGTFNNSITIPPSIRHITQKYVEDEIKHQNKLLVCCGTGEYPNAKSNYYYGHPLLEFNYDLIYSMKWFDEKVVAASLIDAITGCLDTSINGVLDNLCVQENIIKQELNDLIERIIENDDDTVSDCFFTFDNDKFNSLIQTHELNRMGFKTHDGVNGFIPPKPEEIFQALNNLSPNATKEEITTAIQHSLFSAIACGSPLISDTTVSYDFKLDLNIFELLIKKLLYILMKIFLTPKIYMILMFNLKIYEKDKATFNLKQFITYCKTMFTDIILTMKEMIINYFKDLLMKILDQILSLFKPLMLQEQYKYYKELLTSAFECIKLSGNTYNWDVDPVYYADITEAITSTNEEC